MDHFDPNRPHFEPYGLTCVRWKPSPMTRPDTHNEIELNLILSGWVDYLHGGRKLRFRSGQFIAFWASIPHQTLTFSDDCDYLVVTIPLVWFLQFDLPQSFTQNLLYGEVFKLNGRSRNGIEETRFRQWKDDLTSDSPAVANIVLLELEALLARLTLGSAAAKPKRRRTTKELHVSRLNKVEQIARYIAQNYLDPLTADSIAGAVQLHPNYAMNIFKKAFGTTLVDYITHHRISHAQRLLVTTDRKILDIAMSSGFNTLSRFNEAFRRSCGCTPREYRKRQYI